MTRDQLHEELALSGPNRPCARSAIEQVLVTRVTLLRSGGAPPTTRKRGRQTGAASTSAPSRRAPADAGAHDGVVVVACNDPSLITIREFFADTIDNASRLQMGELTTRFAGVRQQRKCDRTDVAVVEKVLGPILGLVLAYTKEARDNEFFTMEQLLDVFVITYRMTRFRGALENRFEWSSSGSTA